MKHCYACTHPDRVEIDAELQHGELSLRTIAGRHSTPDHKLSASGLHRHRSRHLDIPVVGDLIIPDIQEIRERGEFLLQWDGSQWRELYGTIHLDNLVKLPRGIGVKQVFRFRSPPAGSKNAAGP